MSKGVDSSRRLPRSVILAASTMVAATVTVYGAAVLKYFAVLRRGVEMCESLTSQEVRKMGQFEFSQLEPLFVCATYGAPNERQAALKLVAAAGTDAVSGAFYNHMDRAAANAFVVMVQENQVFFETNPAKQLWSWLLYIGVGLQIKHGTHGVQLRRDERVFFENALAAKRTQPHGFAAGPEIVFEGPPAYGHGYGPFTGNRDDAPM